MNKIIIAIDGNSGCGKSSTAKAIAKELGYIYIDTGAMYRAVTLFFIKHDVDHTNALAVKEALKQIDISFQYNQNTGQNETYLNRKNVEKRIREMAVSNLVSPVSELSAVRRKLVEQQRRMGKTKGVIMDGRDIGTVVFPEAELKIYMTASLEVRAERRKKELVEKGVEVALEEVVENLRNRDEIDSTREDSPLRKADDAIVIDTSNLTFDEQVNKILGLVRERL